MAFVSRVNPISVRALKRKTVGSVVRRHGGREDVRFTRVHGGWFCEREDSAEVVSSAVVARECNSAVGCKESWARVY